MSTKIKAQYIPSISELAASGQNRLAVGIKRGMPRQMTLKGVWAVMDARENVIGAGETEQEAVKNAELELRR